MPVLGMNMKPSNELCSVWKSEPSHVPEVQFRVHVLINSVFFCFPSVNPKCVWGQDLYLLSLVRFC